MKKKESEFLIERYQLEHLVPVALTIISVYFWISFFETTSLKIFGIIANLIGLVIWWTAKLTLKENWSAGYGKPRLRKLVTRGIYSKILHPLYWGINLTLIGLAVLYLRTWFAALILIIVIYFFKRMKIEDKYLTKKLGKKYLDYKKKTLIKLP